MRYDVPQLLLEQRGRLEPELKKIGDTWGEMLRVVEWITSSNAKTDPPSGTNEAQWGKEIIVWGETDGGYDGIENVLHLFTKKPGLTLIVSGGVYGRENILNEIPALELFGRLKRLLMSCGFSDRQISERVIIDSMSQHTGHQRIVLGPLLASLAPDTIGVVIPIHHITRFIMTVGLPMYKNGIRPNIQPWPYFTWNMHHPKKGPLDNPDRTFTHEELFALPPTPSKYEGKLDCGEIDKILMYASPSERQCLTFRQARKWLGI